MKKLLSVLLVIAMCASLFCLVSCGKKEEAGKEDGITAFVTIASEGELSFYEDVTVTDADKDGVVSLSDAIYCAHEAKYDGGAAAGYLAEETEFGISIFNLWGVENGGIYGFYLNNAYVDTLAAPIADGDIVSAYSYKDLEGFSDVFSYFDKSEVSAGEVSLTLSYISFDENFMPVAAPAANIGITINGEPVNSITDENGNVILTLKAGDVVSAYTDTMTLVPPVCVAE